MFERSSEIMSLAMDVQARFPTGLYVLFIDENGEHFAFEDSKQMPKTIEALERILEEMKERFCG